MMPQKPTQQPLQVSGFKKRKEPPSGAVNSSSKGQKRPKFDHRAKFRDARSLATQASSKAFRNGELDVDKFVKAREYEIRALEDGMSRSKKALTTRAFQQVPKELRRRTASHNVKRVPKRLRARAKREMAEDNTPTVTARRRKPTRHMRLRLETAKKLRALGAKRKDSQCPAPASEAGVLANSNHKAKSVVHISTTAIKTRAPMVKKATLASAPIPKAKFRKRQINKSWLPTHMFHAKRAHMTAPKSPLWRFAMPLTPTIKSYRPTHRAANDRGAVAWDTSYMATIGLEGQQRSIEGILGALGVRISGSSDGLWSKRGDKWRRGTRVWQGFVVEREAPHRSIAPVTIIWCAVDASADQQQKDEPEKCKRSVIIRVHPSAFFQTWEEILRLGKVAKPQVTVEDLRFEIGSIEITGPGGTEALQGAVWPSPPASGSPQHADDSVQQIWKTLTGLSDLAMLPAEVLLGFDIQDPRMHQPPRTIKSFSGMEHQNRLLEALTTWPPDRTQGTSELFKRHARLKASSSLPSQRAINRLKSAAAPGHYPEPHEKDPKIPVLMYCAGTPHQKQRVWTILLPWKCVQPVWYSVMYYPLSSGGQPRFGGLQEKRQLAFESGSPWFPADFPGTKAGWDWELSERAKRKNEWERKPKGKRVNWDALDLGDGRKGEVGLGWSCHWEILLHNLPATSSTSADADRSNAAGMITDDEDNLQGQDAGAALQAVPPQLRHMSSEDVGKVIEDKTRRHSDEIHGLGVVRLALLSRGVPEACARIYRLPSATRNADLRKRWLALHPSNQPTHKHRSPRDSLPRVSKDEPAWMVQRRLAQALLEPPRPGESTYPACPSKEDLIGFVTTGNFNLGEGQGTGIGSIVIGKVVDGLRDNKSKGSLCIVRNAGNEIGRLARFDFV